MNEIKKNKRTGLLKLVMISILIIVSFQGMLGLMEPSIDETKISVTALSMYFRVFLPIVLSLVIAISLYNERRNEGILVYYYHAYPLTKVYRNKWWAYHIQAIIIYVLCMIYAMLFIFLEGGNPLTLENFNVVLYSIMGIMVLVNTQLFVSIIFNNPILSVVVGLLGAIGNFIVPSTALWPYYPWSYPYRMLYHASVQSEQVMTIIVILVFSFVALRLSAKRFERIMISQ